MHRDKKKKPLMKLDITLKIVNILAGVLTVINLVIKLLKG